MKVHVVMYIYQLVVRGTLSLPMYSLPHHSSPRHRSPRYAVCFPQLNTTEKIGLKDTNKRCCMVLRNHFSGTWQLNYYQFKNVVKMGEGVNFTVKISLYLVFVFLFNRCAIYQDAFITPKMQLHFTILKNTIIKEFQCFLRLWVNLRFIQRRNPLYADVKHPILFLGLKDVNSSLT